ncbi:MAG TPA: sulfatase-like hydrolase/transferase [Bacilli bacterium]|nr:sulfatase-like hydrolase/transferase [Bacilli bacterium]
MLNGLEEKGTLDDTVLVLYGDHYPNGISTNNLNEALSYDTSLDMNAERVPFVIYNSEVTTGVKYHQYTTYVNILPTVANLFNLNYDPRVYMGTDLFSDDYNSMSVFADGSWKNEYAYYNASTGEVKYYKEHYSSSDIQRINSIIQAKLEMSSLAIETNYFNYLENSLNNFDKEISDSELCYTKYKDYYIEEYGDDYDGEVE